MEPSIFRKSSLERAQSPERLNEYVKITNPGIWSVLVGCLAMLVAVAFWGFYGVIPDTMTAFGTIFPEEGVTAVTPMGSGQITDMRVKPGDTVVAGQIVAVILQDELLREIDQARMPPSRTRRILPRSWRRMMPWHWLYPPSPASCCRRPRSTTSPPQPRG